MAKRRKMPTDVNQRAKSIVDFATCEEPAPDDRDPAAVESGRRGGTKGVKTRAELIETTRLLEKRRLERDQRRQEEDQEIESLELECLGDGIPSTPIRRSPRQRGVVATRLIHEPRKRGRRYAADVLVFIDDALTMSRRVFGGAARRAQFHVHAWRTAMEPETQEWVARIEREFEGGSLRGDTSRSDIDAYIAKERHQK